jgi:phage tail-like protein
MPIAYPYRVFRYQVEIDGISRAGFSEVSGMSSSVDPIEYREGDDLRNTPRKLAGLTKFGNVTFRWGVSDDSDFLEWVYSVAQRTPRRLRVWCATTSL